MLVIEPFRLSMVRDNTKLNELIQKRNQKNLKIKNFVYQFIITDNRNRS